MEGVEEDDDFVDPSQRKDKGSSQRPSQSRRKVPIEHSGKDVRGLGKK